MSEKIISRVWYAGFENGEKMTAWYLSKDKLWSVLRGRFRNKAVKGRLLVRAQRFIEKSN